jgi:hypothetical protein
VGFPIRKSSDQSLFAAPQGLSQRTTSFIASQRQGIHRMLLLHLITLMIDGRLSNREVDPIQRSPPGLGAPAAIGKTCLWNSHSKDVCLPNASSPHPLRGTCRPKIKDPGTGHMHYLFTMSNTRDRSPVRGTTTNCKNLNRTLKPQPHRGDHTHATRPKLPRRMVEPDGIEPTT